MRDPHNHSFYLDGVVELIAYFALSIWTLGEVSVMVLLGLGAWS